MRGGSALQKYGYTDDYSHYAEAVGRVLLKSGKGRFVHYKPEHAAQYAHQASN